MNLSVTKYDGRRQPYSQEKILRSILRSGIKKDEATKVLAQVESKLYDGIPTSQIYEIVHPQVNSFYRVREALAKMGPISFEKFVARLLEKMGFSCRWNVISPGFCIEHQIDVVARDTSGKNYFVEVKHHQNAHRLCGLGKVTDLWARFEDLRQGFESGRSKENFLACWLVCNTKFSEHAKKYGSCRGVKLTGWQHGFDEEIEKLSQEEIDQLITPLSPDTNRDYVGGTERG